jgi:uncharacterized protein with beta-barrel porin domain
MATCALAALAVVPTTSRPAYAACDQTGSTVDCTGITTNYNAGSQDGLTFTVQPGATLQGTGGTSAFKLTSGVSGNALINNGTIDGLVDITSSGPGVDTFTNNGVLKITDPNTDLKSHSLFGTGFTQTASGTFMARIDANGFNDSVLVNSATLAGRLVIVVQPGLYTGANTYTVVSSTNPVVGAFDSISVTSPFFTYSVTNCACNVDVTLTPIAFNAVPGLTSNQQKVANVLQNLYASGTPTGSLATFYSNLFAADSLNVFDHLSGAGTAAAQNVSFGAAELFNNAMTQQGISWITGAPGGFGAPLQYAADDQRESKPGYEAFATTQPHTRKAPEWRAWALGFGSTRSIDGSGGSADQSIQTAGGTFGVERTFGPDLLLGLAAGGSSSNFSASSLSTSGTIDGGHVGGYLARRWGDIYALATVSYARFDNATNRTIAGIGTTENAHGRFASDQVGGRVEIGWRRQIAGNSVTPFVAVEPAALWQQAYTESSTTVSGGNGTLGLSYATRETTSLPTFVGAQLDTQYLVGGQTVRPFVRAAWVHEFMPERQVEASFVSIPSASFTVDGARPARDAARLSGGATWAIDASKAVFARVDSEFSGSSTMVAGTAGARITW